MLLKSTQKEVSKCVLYSFYCVNSFFFCISTDWKQHLYCLFKFTCRIATSSMQSNSWNFLYPVPNSVRFSHLVRLSYLVPKLFLLNRLTHYHHWLTAPCLWHCEWQVPCLFSFYCVGSIAIIIKIWQEKTGLYWLLQVWWAIIFQVGSTSLVWCISVLR